MTEKETKQTEGGKLLPFDPLVVVFDVAKNWMLIVCVALIVGMAAYVFGQASYKPVYQTSITYVTYSRTSANTVYSNITAANIVASVFGDLLNGSLLHDTITQQSGLPPFEGTIYAGVIPETNLVVVTVSGADARSVFLMAKAIVDHHEMVTYQVVDSVSLELLRSPAVPVAPINTADAINLAKKATVLAAAAMVVLLGYLSLRQNKVRSEQEATTKLDCSYLGDIPHERKYKSFKALLQRRKTKILVTNPLASFRFVESFRKLSSRVEYHMHGKKVIMVTSLLENEGKSTVAVNLAMSMALKHERVLLID